MERVDTPAKYRKRRTAVMSSRHKRRLIGTPDYIAPEIINGISLTNFTIDWWSLGVMAYELLIGTRPFCAESIDEVIDNITNFKLEWPEVGR
jgi:serine/threonine protein kinase